MTFWSRLALIATISTVLVTAFAYLGWQSYAITENSAYEEFNARQLIAAKSTALGIERDLTAMSCGLCDIGGSKAVLDSDQRRIDDTIRGQLKELRSDGVTRIGITDQNGDIKYATDRGAIGKTVGKPTAFDPDCGINIADSGGEKITLASPIVKEDDPGGNPAGWVFAEIDLETLIDDIVGDYRISAGEFPLLIDREAKVLWSPDESLADRDMLEVSRDYGKFQSIVGDMSSGRSDLGRYTFRKYDFSRGEFMEDETEWLIAYAPVEAGSENFAIGFSAPREDATKLFQAAAQRQLALLTSIICVILFGASIALNMTIRKGRHREKQVEKETKVLVENEETQKVVSDLLSLSLEDIPIDDMLTRALEMILSIEWIAFTHRGAIFIVDQDPNVLVMKAQKRLSPILNKKCAIVPFGSCYCGLAAQTQEIQFVDHVDERHRVISEDMEDHGHYSVPLVAGGKTLGVLNIYLREKHQRTERENEFLNAVANTLSGVIQRKRFEDERDRSEQHLRSLIESSSDSICDISLDGRYIGANLAGCLVCGCSDAKSIAGRDCNENVIVNLDEAGEAVNKAATGETIELEYMTRDPRGREIWWDSKFTPVRIGDGPIQSILRVSRDITIRKKAESELLFRSLLLDNATDSVLAFDRNGKTIYANKAVRETTGYSETDLASLAVDDLFEAKEGRTITDAVKDLSGAGQKIILEIAQKRKNASRVPVELIIQPADLKGDIFIAVARDITERKQSEEAIERQAAELARSNADLERFAYVASHDLQEPLRMVSSFMQLLSRRYEDKLDDTAREYIDFAVDGAARMKILIDDLLAFSRVTPENSKLDDVDCGEALESVLSNIVNGPNGSEAEITHDKLPTVQADRSQLAQLFQNLISNAIKFQAPGRTPKIHISAERGSDSWVLSVSDNGIGIEPRFAKRIFELFQRLHHRSEYPGTGIGLAICARILERHGGRIWAEPNPDGGSIFRCELPDNPPVTAPISS